MANYETLKSAIQQVVKTNGNNEITGALLQQSLLAMINSLGDGYQFAGIATPKTNPETPDAKLFYIAGQSGNYVNFNAYQLKENIVVFVYENNNWVGKELPIINSDDNIKKAVDIATLNKYVGIGDSYQTGFYIASSNLWVIGNHTFYLLHIKPGDVIRMYDSFTIQYAFLSELKAIKNLESPVYCEGTQRATANNDVTVTAPQDAKYLYVLRSYDGTDNDVKITINGVRFTLFNVVDDIYKFAYSPYVSSDKTFNDAPMLYVSAALRKVVFNETLNVNRIAIYAFNISLGTLNLWFANCDQLGDNDTIQQSNVFATATIDNISSDNNGVIRVDIKRVMGGSEIIGYALIDLLAMRKFNIYSSVPKTYANSGLYYIDSDYGNRINALENAVGKTSLLTSPIKALGDWNIRLAGNSQSYMIPKQSIVLENDGDELEIQFGAIDVTSFESGGYAFTKGVGGNNVRGIFVSSNFIRLRSDDGTWLFDAKAFSGNSKFRVKYEDSKIKLYVNDTISATYDGQKKITIIGFGNGVVSQYQSYWKGVISNVKYNNVLLSFTDAFNYGQDVTLYRRNGFLTDEQAESLGTGNERFYVKKTATELSLYRKSYGNVYIKYPLQYRHANYVSGQYPSFYDNWGIGKPVLCAFNGDMEEIAPLFSGAEAELAVNVLRGDTSADFTYVGGVMHGFENIVVDSNQQRKITMLINNIRYDESATLQLMPVSSVEVIQETELVQAYTNTNPFAIATKQWKLTDNGLEITTSLKLLRSIQFAQAQFGMFGVLRHWGGLASNNYLTNKAIKNDNVYKVYDISDDWESDPNNSPLKTKDKECTKIVAYGERNIGFSLEIKDATTKPNGGMFIGTNGGQAYNKIYFDLTGSYTPSVDEVLKATQIWHIE